jgi:hypothetical protein
MDMSNQLRDTLLAHQGDLAQRFDGKLPTHKEYGDTPSRSVPLSLLQTAVHQNPAGKQESGSSAANRPGRASSRARKEDTARIICCWARVSHEAERIAGLGRCRIELCPLFRPVKSNCSRVLSTGKPASLMRRARAWSWRRAASPSSRRARNCWGLYFGSWVAPLSALWVHAGVGVRTGVGIHVEHAKRDTPASR